MMNIHTGAGYRDIIQIKLEGLLVEASLLVLEGVLEIPLVQGTWSTEVWKVLIDILGDLAGSPTLVCLLSRSPN